MNEQQSSGGATVNASPSFTLSAVLAFADQSIVTGTNFLTGVLVGRLCAPEEFGLYSLGLTIVLLLKGINRPLIIVPYTTFIRQVDTEGRAQYAGDVLLLQGALAALAVVLVGAGAAVVLMLGEPAGFGAVLWSLAIFVAFMLFRESIRGFYFASFKFGAGLLFDFLLAALQLTLLYLAVSLWRIDARITFSIIGISSGVISLAWLWVNKSEFAPKLDRAREAFHRHWTFGRWLLAGSVTFLLSIQMFPWFLAAFHGTEAVGAFAACTTIVFLLNPLLLGMNNLLGPSTVRARAIGVDALVGLVHKSMLGFVVVLGLFCIGLIFVGEPLLELLFEERYLGSGRIVLLLALATLVQTAGVPAMFGLIALERPQLNLRAGICALACSLTIGLWLTSAYGLVGAAYAKLIGNGVLFGVRWTAFVMMTRSLALEER